MESSLFVSGYNAICQTIVMDAACSRVSIGRPLECGEMLEKAASEGCATADDFVLAARQYLASAGARACQLICNTPGYAEYDLGFRTRRAGDALYVTQAAQEERLPVGTRIVAVGGKTIPDVMGEAKADVFGGRDTDREDWDLTLRAAGEVDVVYADGQQEHLELRRYPVSQPQPRLCVSEAAGDNGAHAVVLRIDDLTQVQRIRELLVEVHAALRRGADRLVLDLRRCEGDADPWAYLDLLPYLVDKDSVANELLGDFAVYTVYSPNNVRYLMQGIEASRPRFDAENPGFVDQLLASVRQKGDQVMSVLKGAKTAMEQRAFVELPEMMPTPVEADRIRVAFDAPARTVILVDTTTGVGAERLAQAVMGMERVSLVGRMTPGLVDYTNPMTIDLQGLDSMLVYPISRSQANHDGAGYARTGLPLDVHVPFEPRECTQDVILEKALEL